MEILMAASGVIFVAYKGRGTIVGVFDVEYFL